jgi:two-component system phosphate regulon sensor histidine kinase PhoR
MEYQFKMQRCAMQVQLSKEERIIQADPDAVAEAITNLLSNALKYSPERKQISISTFCQGDFVAVAVEDQGIGIARDDLNNIFEPFYRSKDQTAHRVGGAGLGLALVQHIMKAHEGKIEVESTLGKGSTFTLLFPLRKNHETNFNH